MKTFLTQLALAFALVVASVAAAGGAAYADEGVASEEIIHLGSDRGCGGILVGRGDQGQWEIIGATSFYDQSAAGESCSTAPGIWP